MHSSPNTPTVPFAPSSRGTLEGWTSCCGASVTYGDSGALCCKKCWSEVAPDFVADRLPEADALRLGEAILTALVDPTSDVDAAIVTQREVAGYPTAEAAARCYS